VKFVHTKLLFS